MPPKGHKKMKKKPKKEMLVTSRLMAISLLVDDYIYKNKPISLLEAKKFHEEIISLKLKCKDTRSLQVVEKLKIFMKSIIKIQSIKRLQEDSTNIVTESSVDKNTLFVISEDVENNITNNLTASTNTELFSNRESQSSEIDNIQNNNTQNKISITITNPVTSVSNSEMKPVESKEIITSNNLILTLNDKSAENMENIDFISKTTNEKEQEKQDSVTLITSNLQKHPEHEKKCFQENEKSNKISTETKNKENQTNVNKKITKNKTAVKSTSKSKPKKAINKELEKKSTNQSSQSRKKRKEQNQMNISWIENIKHVREVSTDEHTDLQIEDSFWNNLDLPGIWNANEFD